MTTYLFDFNKTSVMDYSRKNPKVRGWWLRTYLKKTPGSFTFVTLPLELSDKIRLHHWKLHRIVLHALEFPRPKTKTPLEVPLLFYGLLEIEIPLETACPEPPCLDFFWNSPILELDLASRKKLTIFLIL